MPIQEVNYIKDKDQPYTCLSFTGFTLYLIQNGFIIYLFWGLRVAIRFYKREILFCNILDLDIKMIIFSSLMIGWLTNRKLRLPDNHASPISQSGSGKQTAPNTCSVIFFRQAFCCCLKIVLLLPLLWMLVGSFMVAMSRDTEDGRRKADIHTYSFNTKRNRQEELQRDFPGKINIWFVTQRQEVVNSNNLHISSPFSSLEAVTHETLSKTCTFVAYSTVVWQFLIQRPVWNVACLYNITERYTCLIRSSFMIKLKAVLLGI